MFKFSDDEIIDELFCVSAEAPSLFSQCMRTLRVMRDANQIPKLIPNLPPYIQGMLYFQQ